ncbi:MAG: type II secretion system protein GspE, partial [Leptospira sp.]|nr:type II secretion system protein GspE [Leptospira sp.]
MRKTLGEVLVEDGIITEKDLAETLKAQQKSQIPLTQIIQKRGLAGEIDIMKALAKLHGLTFLEKIEFHKIEECYK